MIEFNVIIIDITWIGKVSFVRFYYMNTINVFYSQSNGTLEVKHWFKHIAFVVKTVHGTNIHTTTFKVTVEKPVNIPLIPNIIKSILKSNYNHAFNVYE